MNKNPKFTKGLVVFLIILGLAACGVIISAATGRFKKNVSFSLRTGNVNIHKDSDSRKISKGKPYIAVLHVEGTIQKAGNTYNQEWILSKIEKFRNDPNNKSIILFIDSPGGTVYESDETYFALQKYKSSGKKVYAYLGSLAASGGYYIACAADTIYANRNTLTGSIGVIAGQFIDVTEFLEDHGILYETIHAGKNKNMGNYNESITDEQIEIMQSIADECYEQFTSIVAKSRNINYEEILPLCDGRIYTAKQALGNGLIDCIDTFDNLVDHIKLEDEQMAACQVIDFSYQKQQSFFEKMLNTAVKPQKADSYFSGVTSPMGIPSAMWEEMNMKGPLYLYK